MLERRLEMQTWLLDRTAPSLTYRASLDRAVSRKDTFTTLLTVARVNSKQDPRTSNVGIEQKDCAKEIACNKGKETLASLTRG